MSSPLTTIVSDAQAGAARGALDAAIELDLDYGGWAPRGIGVPAIYRERTRWAPTVELAARLNVQDSDGTLVISGSPDLAPGTPAAFVDTAAERQRKALLHIVLPAHGRSELEDVRKAVVAWVVEERILVLHVSGPSEVEEPGIQQAVRDALVWIFEDEVLQPSPTAQAFAEKVIGPMVDATFAPPGYATIGDEKGIDHAQQEPSPTPHDAGSSPRPRLRQEDGDPADGGEGVREGRQGARSEDPSGQAPVTCERCPGCGEVDDHRCPMCDSCCYDCDGQCTMLRAREAP